SQLALIGERNADPSAASGVSVERASTTLPDRAGHLGVSALAGSLEQCEATFKDLEELDVAAQDGLVAAVADGLMAKQILDTEPEQESLVEQAQLGREALQRLTLAFAGKVVSIAHWNRNKI